MIFFVVISRVRSKELNLSLTYLQFFPSLLLIPTLLPFFFPGISRLISFTQVTRDPSSSLHLPFFFPGISRLISFTQVTRDPSSLLLPWYIQAYILQPGNQGPFFFPFSSLVYQDIVLRSFSQSAKNIDIKCFFKRRDRLCNIFELRMQYCREKLKDSFDTNETFLLCTIFKLDW